MDSLNKFFPIIKHEMLHALGFAHVSKGIMMPGSGEYHIDFDQLRNWHAVIEENGGFKERSVPCFMGVCGMEVLSWSLGVEEE